ncbi:MAG: hypothetical protein DMD40_02595 [Gemmatimonadetes bacterium]|nr:MAG: hypothetical protein DMD40_02595 [Gemmatimonadota bacterium]
MAREGRDADRYGALAPQEGRRTRHISTARETRRVVGRLRKPHGQHGEVAVIPLVENPGTVFVPKARVYVLNEERTVLAGPLVVARRRSYHREWLLGFEGVTSRAAVESWRDQLVAVDE